MSIWECLRILKTYHKSLKQVKKEGKKPKRKKQFQKKNKTTKTTKTKDPKHKQKKLNGEKVSHKSLIIIENKKIKGFSEMCVLQCSKFIC